MKYLYRGHKVEVFSWSGVPGHCVGQFSAAVDNIPIEKMCYQPEEAAKAAEDFINRNRDTRDAQEAP
jgi:hypothetical protein